MTVPVVVVAVVVVVAAVVHVVATAFWARLAGSVLPYANVNGFQPKNCAKWQKILVFNISKDCRRCSFPAWRKEKVSATMIKLLTNLCSDVPSSFLAYYNIDL